LANSLYRKLQQRRDADAFRQLRLSVNGIDFCSNDYLGIVRNKLLQFDHEHEVYGSTGSRLISGNYPLIEEVEKQLAVFHNAEASLIFNSGYDANTGLLSSVPQRGDTVLYDQLSHASIRDGIRLSLASSFSFEHNNVDDLEKRLQAARGNIFVVTESVFSMDGDVAPLKEIVALCEEYDANLIVDEAHATGVIGENGEGLVHALGLEKNCFARLHTFGKAVGCHGAVILGDALLRDYLVNFCRPFIYTTALPPAAVKAIAGAYALFPSMVTERSHLNNLIEIFREKTSHLHICRSLTPIQGIIIPGNENVKRVALGLQQNGFDVRPILHPTVPKGQERLRIVMHSFNTAEEVMSLIDAMSAFANAKNE
jgi:8-amino-7-oxononanoate synthase